MQSPSLRWKRPLTLEQRPPPPTRCPFGGSHKKLCTNQDCDYCFERSLASNPEAYSMFVSSSTGEPFDRIKRGSHQLATWQCPICPHTWKAPVDSFSRGGRCPYCFSSRLCEDASCSFCFDASLASDEGVARMFVSSSAGATPRAIRKYSQTKATWKCVECSHSWTSSISNVTFGSTGCPFCKSSKLLRRHIVQRVPCKVRCGV